MSVQIILNKNKKYEVVTVRNGNLLDTTNPQQYERIAGALGKVKSTLKEYEGCPLKYVSDTTVTPPVMWVVYADKRKTEKTELKFKGKIYVPAKKK